MSRPTARHADGSTSSSRGLAALLALALGAGPAGAQGWLDSARWFVHAAAGENQYVADVDGDGFDDLVWFKGVPGTPTKWEGFRVLFNDGAGDVSEGPYVAFPPSVNRYAPLTIEGVRGAVDLTGDGQVDVLVVERQTGTTADVRVLVYPGLGGGSFGAPLSIPVTGVVDAAAVGQADADAAAELAMVLRLTNQLVIAWWDFNGASFQPQPPITLPSSPIGPAATRMIALDLDGDGDDDLAYGEASGNRLVTFRTAGAALLPSQVVSLATANYTHLYPYRADLDGDGTDDVLVVNTGYNDAAFSFVPVRNQGGTLVPGPAQALVGDSTIWGDSFDVVDWDRDGDVDALYFPWQQPGGTTEAIVAFFENLGGDVFSTQPVAKSETIYSEAYLPVASTDFDRDGDPDLVLPQAVLFGRGRFESSPSTVTDPFYGSQPRLALDHDGDGDLDLFLDAASVRINDGAGGFAAGVETPAAPAGLAKRRASAIGDFSGDGRVDFLVPLEIPSGLFTPPQFQEMRLYRATETGAFADGGTAKVLSMEPYTRSLNLALDLDGDGDTDVLDLSAAGGGYWPNHGTGTFAAFQILFGPFDEPSAVADLDGDGDLDAITYRYADRVDVQVNQGALSFVPSALHQIVGFLDPDSPTLADLDNDGDLDVAFASNSEAFLFRNDGTASFTLATTLSTDHGTLGNDPRVSHFAFDDVDGDGRLDILAGSEGESSDVVKRVLLYRGTAPFAFEGARTYVAWASATAGDLDGDGDLDVAGRSVVRSRRFDGPADGVIEQYGAGTEGSGGAVPLIGAAGPLRPGSTSAALRVRRVVGGTGMVLMFSPQAAELAGVPFLAATLYVQPPLGAVPLVAGGPAGVAALGALDLPLAPVLAAVAGSTVYAQILAGDPGAPSGLSVSNGLRLTFGL